LRREGRSGYTLRKLAGLWLNMFTGFSVLPLRAASLLGGLFGLAGLVLAAVFAIEKFRNPDLPAGWASLIVSLFIVSGVQLISIGMVGEYLGRLFLKESGRPQYVVRRTVNCGAEEE
jgi:undecaprenyl-phosphate 4-deoxy-4-formamido-L-arabinose transferase